MATLTPSEKRRRIRLTVIACVAVLVANAVVFVSRMPPSTPATRAAATEGKKGRYAPTRAPSVPAGTELVLAPDDSAARLVASFLELSRAGPGRATLAAVDSFIGCHVSGTRYQPIEMLASYRLTARFDRGDTAIVRAEVITVAEEDASRQEPDRYEAVQRVRRGEWEWDVVREGGRLRVCNGPRFGFYGSDSVTSWRPAGASSVTARALADSVWRATAGAASLAPR